MSHGTTSAYTQGCRCEPCRGAQREYDRQRYERRRRVFGRGCVPVDRKLLREALQELFPMGLTDDCPARRGQR